MGILSNILGKLFPASHAAPPSATPASTPTPNAPAPAPAPTTTSASPAAAPPHRPLTEVDTEKLLDDLAAKSSQKLNWKTSIVDLLKLLDLDSSLNSRKELAKELNYTGDTNDSATMNVWLHRQVMTKVAANGGKVPADLRD